MADHVSQQVLTALEAIIIAAGTSAGANVFTGRVTPIPPEQLPAVKVNGGNEFLERRTEHKPALIQRTHTVELEALVRDLDGYDAQAYTLLKELEHVIDANPTANGTARAIFPIEVRWERAAEGDKPIVRATLALTAFAFTYSNAVDVPA